jgi:hypothetical protein
MAALPQTGNNLKRIVDLENEINTLADILGQKQREMDLLVPRTREEHARSKHLLAEYNRLEGQHERLEGRRQRAKGRARSRSRSRGGGQGKTRRRR